MLSIPPSIAQIYQTNIAETSLAAMQGTTITASATPHDLGVWTAVIDPTDKPSYGMWVEISEVRQANVETSQLMNISFGSAGNEEILVEHINATAAGGRTSDPTKWFFFPVYVPEGVRVAAQIRALAVSDTCVVGIWLGQDPLYPFVCGKVETYGADTGSSRGTLITPGNDAWGSWTQMGSSGSVRDHRYWSIGMDLGDTDFTVGSGEMPWLIEVGIGPDSGNVTKIAGIFKVGAVVNEAITGPWPTIQYAPVPRGELVWARFANSDPGSTVRGVLVHGMD